MNPEEQRASLRKHYEQSRQSLLSAIEGLSDPDMSLATIDGWSVKDHLTHVTAWDEIRASEIERISGGGEPAWRPMTEDEVEAFNAMIERMRSSLPLKQVLAELESSRARVLAAIDAATERGLDETRYGEAGLRSDHEFEHADIIRRWRERRSG